MTYRSIYILLCFILCFLPGNAKNRVADYVPAPYTWITESRNSSESMPLGGHDIGMNVWVENDDILIYMLQSGWLDENGTLLKAGRLRLHLGGPKVKGVMSKDSGDGFSQTLNLDEGCMYIKCGDVKLRLWADVYSPVIYVDVDAGAGIDATLSYESWRYKDRPVSKGECQQGSWKWYQPADCMTYADSITPTTHGMSFYHQNRANTVYDYALESEKLDGIRDSIPNTLGGKRYSGILNAPAFNYCGTTDGRYASTDFRAWNFRASNIKHTTFSVILTQHKDIQASKTMENGSLKHVCPDAATSAKRSAKWWHEYWQRSYIKSDTPEAQKLIRNYELFRYMLGCNAYGEWPTKFNGGLFTFDPQYVDSVRTYTPDYRCWGGSTMTAQNQRLVYWPMLKSGDTDMMAAQFDTYLRMLHAAMARVRHYWGHDGALFEEQLESFGLPNPAEYGKHKPGQDPGWMKNKWLEYTWDTSLEFCQMILLANEYSAMDISKYKPLIKECLVFFDEHYQQLARQRGAVALDGNGKLIIYPGSGCETYKMAYNPSSTIAALRCVLETIDKHHGGLSAWDLDTAFINRIPEIPTCHLPNSPFGGGAGSKTLPEGKGWGGAAIAPAVTWSRINNVESPQLYPVFPWRIYGLGRPDLEVARNTYLYDEHCQKMRSSTGWKQDNIWAADLGLEDEAVRLNTEKFADGPYRFPAFWPQGFDWAPDHNRGGSAMIGLQEMLLQEVDDADVRNSTLLLFPCWPKTWNCEFRLHATGGRIVEATLKDGRIYNAEGMDITADTDWRQMLSQIGNTLPDLPDQMEDANRPAYLTKDNRIAPNSWRAKGYDLSKRSPWGLWTNYDDLSSGLWSGEDSARLGHYTPLPLLTTGYGKKITTPSQWYQIQRPQLEYAVRQELIGFLPVSMPQVDFVLTPSAGERNGHRYTQQDIKGRIDCSGFPALLHKPGIKATLRLPADIQKPVPVMIIVAWNDDEIDKYWDILAPEGWGVCTFIPTTVQPDNGVSLTDYLIGLINKGAWRKPDCIGTIGAWQWGVSRLIDKLQTTSGVKTDAIGIMGHSRYGKTALYTAALDERIAIAFPSDSGCLGTAMNRRHWGEDVETTAYWWMCGNILRYCGSLKRGQYMPRKVENMTVDAHTVMSLVAPRPVFYNSGDESRWADPYGMFLTGKYVTPVYELLGKKGLVADPKPIVDKDYIDGTVGYRLHKGGHTDMPDWPAFIKFAKSHL